MKIALFGYGKMGHMVEQSALERGHEIILKLDAIDEDDLPKDDLAQADMAIDFSTPDAVLDNINTCFALRLPIVVGTTGWYQHLHEVKNRCDESNNTLLYASNFSIGVNMVFHINKLLAKMMKTYPQYDVQVEEIHHVHKLDSPSGTAITLADDIIEGIGRKKEWVNYLSGNANDVTPQAEQLLIESHRINEVPGTHTVIYSSAIDDIEIKHTAHNRYGFAIGAVIAAEWLKDKKGFYSMNDMFNFGI